MLNKKTWNEFQACGLLWYVNTLLHIFGWAIVIRKDSVGNIVAYPARTNFRGFDSSINDEGYRKVTNYILANASELKKDLDLDDFNKTHPSSEE